MTAPLSLSLCFLALLGCYSRTWSPPENARQLTFLGEEVVPGAGLYRTSGALKLSDLMRAVYQEPSAEDQVESTYCSLIGLTKAAMWEYGVDGIATWAAPPDRADASELVVTLKNGESVVLLPFHRDVVRGAIHFGTTSSTEDAAVSLSDDDVAKLVEWFYAYFAVAAVRVQSSAPESALQRLSDECGERLRLPEQLLFRASLLSVANGFYAGNIPSVYGLFFRAPRRAVGREQGDAVGGIGYNTGHTMFLAAARDVDGVTLVVDRYGNPTIADDPLLKERWLQVPQSDGERDATRRYPGMDWDPILSTPGERRFVCEGLSTMSESE